MFPLCNICWILIHIWYTFYTRCVTFKCTSGKSKRDKIIHQLALICLPFLAPSCQSTQGGTSCLHAVVEDALTPNRQHIHAGLKIVVVYSWYLKRVLNFFALIPLEAILVHVSSLWSIWSIFKSWFTIISGLIKLSPLEPCQLFQLLIRFVNNSMEGHILQINL